MKTCWDFGVAGDGDAEREDAGALLQVESRGAAGGTCFAPGSAFFTRQVGLGASLRLPGGKKGFDGVLGAGMSSGLRTGTPWIQAPHVQELARWHPFSPHRAPEIRGRRR